jgi:hypothetical protein
MITTMSQLVSLIPVNMIKVEKQYQLSRTCRFIAKFSPRNAIFDIFKSIGPSGPRALSEN